MGYQYVILDGKVSALKGVGQTPEALSLAEELTKRSLLRRGCRPLRSNEVN